MKKSLFFIPVIALVILLTMTQCKKNYSCGLKITCNYTTTGLDTGEAVANAILEIYPGAVASGRTVHPAIEQYKDTDRTHRLGRSRATGNCPAALEHAAMYAICRGA